ncbi:heptaprenyl diphosphate synthase [Amycolatopsis bartoniae]|uniref:Geranylgeranyl pyrophosphate synthase n=1 Tax=Amycolatopsis bartoniae TaxID=941986 RepID=A0A8H9IPQ0_9PSEU|nr:polyprenyl synthetase family protein [Amycolatopsis bartoniae]MBB2937825.1 heptaprenyl diphosphate synthase [Amycolatopsis bartoniae]TVT06511.1 polyprenyl synthetase family protein [Amycolatopsis bartoniae]GHF40992.1 geranylgeranyl pyrophosphate synthase [Amycolatopsis bartoniae]
MDYQAAVRSRMRELCEDLPSALKPAVVPFVDRAGKGARAALVAAAAAGGRADRTELVRLGAIVELLHLASLIHDDVVDRAATRRDLPSAHERVGPDLALLAGTACVALVGQESADLGPRTAAAVARCTAALALGQLMDVERAYDTGLDLDAYVAIVVRKTSELFVLSCVLGAGAAGREPAFAAAVAEFARQLGVCFQIEDDCKDFLPAGSGKPAGTDHRLGFYGLPTLHALAVRPGELAALLLAPEIGDAELARIRELVLGAGGLDRAVREARRRRELAFAALAPVEPEPATALREVADALWTF